MNRVFIRFYISLDFLLWFSINFHIFLLLEMSHKKFIQQKFIEYVVCARPKLAHPMRIKLFFQRLTPFVILIPIPHMAHKSSFRISNILTSNFHCFLLLTTYRRDRFPGFVDATFASRRPPWYLQCLVSTSLALEKPFEPQELSKPHHASSITMLPHTELWSWILAVLDSVN